MAVRKVGKLLYAKWRRLDVMSNNITEWSNKPISSFGRSSGHEAPISNPLCERLGHVTGRSQTQYKVRVALQVSII